MPPSPPTKHHILLLGGTGNCGQLFTRAALEAGHTITLYLRTPSKLSPELSEHPNIRIIQGQLDDAEGLQKAASCGADVFISLAGPTLGKREGIPITKALQTLYPLLLSHNPSIRILILSTASYPAPQDSRSIKWFLAINAYIRVIGGDSYTEINSFSKETVKLGEDVEWTLFRVPLLTGGSGGGQLSPEQLAIVRGSGKDRSGEEGEKESGGNEKRAKVAAAFVGDKKGKDWIFLERGRLVVWILGELEERKWIRQCPTLANA